MGYEGFKKQILGMGKPVCQGGVLFADGFGEQARAFFIFGGEKRGFQGGCFFSKALCL